MLFFTLIISLVSNANAIDLPVFRSQPHSQFLSHSLKAKEEVQSFRVLIFPHLGTYSTPQGAESNAASVAVNAAAGCDLYQASLDSHQEWVKSGVKLNSAPQTEMTIKATKAGNYFYECSGPFVVKRESTLQSYSYLGNFVSVSDGKVVQLINLVDPEIYLKGVIPSESPPTWALETLKVQAVAARSYAWWSVLDSRAAKVSNYDLDDTVFFQAYQGNGIRTTATDQAADETKGETMVYQGQVIKAYFSADNGGYTEDASAVFPGSFPYCIAQAETYNGTGVLTEWNKAGNVTDLKTKIVKANLLPSRVTIKNMVVATSDRDRSGRVTQMSVIGTDGKTYLIAGEAFRHAMALKSSLYDLQINAPYFAFKGKGNGHGVGMSQIGANLYVTQLHWDYAKILNFYYSGAVLTHE